MPVPDPSIIMTFETPSDLDEWLKMNHATKSELWVKIFKKNSGIRSASWNDVMVEVLCWGWIDGVKKTFDDQSYLQRIAPRKARSIWSKRNAYVVSEMELPADFFSRTRKPAESKALF